MLMLNGTTQIGAATTQEDTLEEETDAYLVEIVSTNFEHITEGDSYQLAVTIKGNDDYTWNNTYVTIDFGEAPIHFNEVNPVRYESYFYPDKEYTFIYDVTSEVGNPGNYTITLQVRGEVYSKKTIAIDKPMNIVVDEVTSSAKFYGRDASETPLEPGETAERSLIIHAENNVYIEHMDMEITTDSDQIAVIEGQVVKDPIFINGQAQIPITLRAAQDAEGGLYTLHVTVDYGETRYEGKAFTYDFDVVVEVKTGASTVDTVLMDSIQVSKESIQVGESTTLSTTVMNTSTDTIDEIQLQLEYPEGIVPVTQDTVVLHQLETGESVPVTFTVEATEEATSRNYAVGLTMAYDGEEIKQYAGVYVSNPDESEVVSQPKLMVTEFSTGNEEIYAGSSFQLAFSLNNTNTETAVKNVKLVLSEEASNVFLTKGTGSSRFVSTLAPNQSVDFTIDYSVLDSAAGDIYFMTIQYSYEDEDGNTYEDSEKLSIPVYQKPSLTISDVRFGSVLDSGYTLEADFYNTGKIDIDNLMVDIELDDVSATNSNYYVGTFESGRTDVYDVEIVGNQPESLSGTLVFTYDDTFGKTVEVRQAFELETTSGRSGMMETIGTDRMQENWQGDMNGEGRGLPSQESEGLSIGKKIASLIGGLSVIGVLVLGIVLYKKKKKVA